MALCVKSPTGWAPTTNTSPAGWLPQKSGLWFWWIMAWLGLSWLGLSCLVLSWLGLAWLGLAWLVGAHPVGDFGDGGMAGNRLQASSHREMKPRHRPRGGLLRQTRSPTGWAPTKATNPSPNGVGAYRDWRRACSRARVWATGSQAGLFCRRLRRPCFNLSRPLRSLAILVAMAT